MLSEDNSIAALPSGNMIGIGVIYHNIIIYISNDVRIVGNIRFNLIVELITAIIAIENRLLDLLLLLLYLLLKLLLLLG